MRHIPISAIVALSSLSFSAFSEAHSLQAAHVAGEILAKFDPQHKSDLLAQLKKSGLEHLRTLELTSGHFLLAKTQDGEKSLSKALTDVESIPGVIYAEPNFIYHAIDSAHTLAPSDPSFELLWGLQNRGNNEPLPAGGRSGTPGVSGADAQVEDAWKITRGSYQVRIAVIDTGIDYDHPDLKENVWTNTAEANGKSGVDDDKNGFVDDIHGFNFAVGNGDPKDGHGHGTHCSGTIAAKHDNGVGVAGMMDEATLIGVKFLADNGQGTAEGAIKSIDYATKLNVDIMSNSWGGGGYSKALEDAISAANKRGIIFIAAAGNNGTENDKTPHYPSNYQLPNVISVAAHTAQDTMAIFSNWGKKTVHIAAPGKNILSTMPNAKYGVMSGTSMATPHVSGAVGLLFALEGRLPVAELRERLVETAYPAPSYRGKVQKGRLSAFNLLTNTRPERTEPVEGAWKTYPLPQFFESAHPYTGDMNVEKSFRVPGAQYVRAVVKKYEMEDKWDVLSVMDGSRSVLETVTGAGQNKITEFVSGETIVLNFKSDKVVHKWGYLVEELQYQ